MRLLRLVLIVVVVVSCTKPDSVLQGDHLVVEIGNNSIEDFSSDFSCRIELKDNKPGRRAKHLVQQLHEHEAELADGSSFYVVNLVNAEGDRTEAILGFGSGDRRVRELSGFIAASCESD